MSQTNPIQPAYGAQDEALIDILTCVNSGIDLRDVQVRFLTWLAENWNKYDVFVGSLPVAAGKSICATALARWMEEMGLGYTALITPTKILQDQYTDEFAYIPVLKGMSEYPCVCQPGASCKDRKRVLERCCSSQDIFEQTGRTGTCPYLEARAIAADAPTALFNFHSYAFCKMHKANLIVDEGHNTANFLYDLYGINIWKCEVDYPDGMEPTAEGVADWLPAHIENLQENLQLAMQNQQESLAGKLEEQIEKYTQIRGALLSDADNMIVKRKRDVYRGWVNREARNSDQEFIFIKPLQVNKFGERFLWPKETVKKVVFLSATINENDMEILGVHNKRVGYFQGQSPIPADRRPIYICPLASMAYRHRSESIPIITKGILRVAEKRPDEKGLVHCTYATAEALRRIIPFGDDRFLFHDKRNKTEVYQRFKKSKKSYILVASGMSEGIDLPDDAARWQIITQIMWPYRGDEVNEWRLKNAPHLYYYEAVRQLEQQAGRVCRNPQDRGDTYIFDKQIWYLYSLTHTKRIQAGAATMWSETFRESIQWPKKKGAAETAPG